MYLGLEMGSSVGWSLCTYPLPDWNISHGKMWQHKSCDRPTPTTFHTMSYYHAEYCWITVALQIRLPTCDTAPANDKITLTFQLAPTFTKPSTNWIDSSKHFRENRFITENVTYSHLMLLLIFTSTTIFPYVLEKELLYTTDASLFLTRLRPPSFKKRSSLSTPYKSLEVKRRI